MLWFWLLACSRVHPDPEGGRLARCPASPNCVSTQASPDDGLHHYPPQPFDGTLADVAQATEAIGCTVVTSGPMFLHATCTTPSGWFTDDVHALLEEGHLHLRSASRLGYGDLGENRDRMDRLIEQLRVH